MSSQNNKVKMNKETFTLTYGDCAENHRGMEKIGNEVEDGLSYDDLENIKEYFEEKKIESELHSLKDLLEGEEYDDVLDEDVEDAYILFARKGINAILGKDGADKLYHEQAVLEKDTKAFMYGRVVNKKARHNLCFSDYTQEADFENKKGTVIKFDDVKLTKKIREEIPKITKRKDLKNLQCEGNYYYDVNKTYIGFHSDLERRVVIACRLGADFPLYFQWYHNCKKYGKLFKVILSHGDMYFMCKKAVGFDGRKRKKFILRHAAGYEKNLNIKDE